MTALRNKGLGALALMLLAGLGTLPASAGDDVKDWPHRSGTHQDWLVETPAWPYADAGFVYLSRPAQNNKGSMAFRCGPGGRDLSAAIALPGPGGFRALGGREADALIARMLQTDRVTFQARLNSGGTTDVTFMTDGFRSGLAQFKAACTGA